MDTMSRIGLSLVCLSVATQVAGAEPIPAAERKAAAGFSLPSDQGDDRKLTLSELKGRVVLVNFWATWCPPCRAEMPSMQALATRLEARPFTVVAVNVGEDEDATFAFRHEFAPPLSFPIALDADASTTRHWSVLGLPTTFLVDRGGRIAYRHVGGWDWDADPARSLVDALLKEKVDVR